MAQSDTENEEFVKRDFGISRGFGGGDRSSVSLCKLLFGLIAVLLLIFIIISVIGYETGLQMTVSYGNNAGIAGSYLLPQQDIVSLSGLSIDDEFANQIKIFNELDMDGDGKLDLTQFTQFISISGGFNEAFQGLENLLGTTQDVITGKDAAILTEFLCGNKCEEYAIKQQVCDGIVEGWRSCLEFMAFQIISRVTNDMNALQMTRQQYTDYIAKASISSIKKAYQSNDDSYIDLIELEFFQKNHVKPNLENYPLFEHILANNNNLGRQKLKEFASNYELTLSPKEISEAKEKYDRMQMEKRDSRRLLDNCSPCCNEHDCDTWDTTACTVAGGVCLGGLVPACMASLQNCPDAVKCLYYCDECHISYAGVLWCDGCCDDFF